MTTSSDASSAETNKRLETHLRSILEEIAAAEGFVEGMSYADFVRDRKTIYATERALQLVGASVKSLPIPFMNKCHQVNWREFTWLGDKLGYGYFEVDLEELWTTVAAKLPALKAVLLEALPS